MAITTQPITGRKGLPTVEHVVPREGSVVLSHFPDIGVGPVREDITSGAVAGQTVTGPARAVEAGKDIVIEASSSGPGLVSIEERVLPSGPWVQGFAFPVLADEPLGCRFTTDADEYRLTFTAERAASRVFMTSQHRAAR